MKFATASIHGRTFVGLLLEDGRILDILRAEKKLFELETVPGDLVQCIQSGEKFINHVKQLEQWARKEEETESYLYTLKEVTLLAPIPRPSKNIYCVGKNYRAHALELGTEADIPEHVMLFSKTPTSVIGHEEKIDPHLHLTTELDYEGELAVVIGKKGKQINKEDALDYIFGYTIVNDITARNMQARHKQFLLGKSLDTSCPMGPVIVHQSSFAHLDFEIETKVNGEVRQRGQGKQMIFSIPDIISTISQGTTLEPGDIIATGTPAGVGKGFNPPKYLRSGDVVEITIEPIGTLRNYVGE